MPIKQILITAGTSWTVPVDWTNNSNIFLFGAGGGGQKGSVTGKGGGGGGAYARFNPFLTTAGSVITYTVGAGGLGGTAVGNATAGGSTTWNAGAGTAGGGGVGAVAPNNTGGNGGTVSGAGYTGSSGGQGGTGAGGSTTPGGSGGGACGGPSGAFAGGSGNASTASGAGGGGGIGGAGVSTGSSGISQNGARGGYGFGGTTGAGAGGNNPGVSGNTGSTTLGGGGGGGAGESTSFGGPNAVGGNGGAGGYYGDEFTPTQTWNGSNYGVYGVAGLGYGSGGGGGGGGGASTSSSPTATGGNGGAGGTPGGGGGSNGDGTTTDGNGGNGGAGGIIVQYVTITNRTLYWVGAAGTWNTTNSIDWSLSSGGVGGEPPPTATDDVIFDANSGSGTVTINGGLCRNLTASSPSVTFSQTGTLTVSGTTFTVSAGATWTDTGTISFTAATVSLDTNGANFNCSFQMAQTQAITLGSNLTCNGVFAFATASVAASLNLNGYDLTCRSLSLASGTRSIAFGTNKIVITSSSGTDTLGLSASSGTGFSYTGTPRVEAIIPGARNLSFTLPTTFTQSNALNLYVLSGTGSFTFFNNANVAIKDLDFTGFSGSVIYNTSGTIRSCFIYGNFKAPSSITSWTSTGFGSTLVLSNTSGTVSVESGEAIVSTVVQDGVGGTVSLSGSFLLNSTYTLTNGTFNANNNNVTVTRFISSNSNTRTITMGSGTWTLTSTGSLWDCATSTNLTVNADTSTIVLSNTSTFSRTFAGGGKTYNNLTIGGATGISVLTISGSNTFNTIASTKTVAHTITFTAGTTTTVSGWTVTGTVGKLVTINSSSAGTQATLTKTGGGVVSGINYLSIQDSNATPGSTWFAGGNSTNVSNNTGWLFKGFSPTNGNFLFFC